MNYVNERRNAVLEAARLFDLNKPFRINELIEMCELNDWDKIQVKKNLSIWTNPKFSSVHNDRIRKVIHRLSNMGTGWYVKVAEVGKIKKVPDTIDTFMQNPEVRKFADQIMKDQPKTETFTAESYPKPMKKGGLVKDDAIEQERIRKAIIDAPSMKFELEPKRDIARYYLFGIRVWEVVKFVK